MELLTWVKTVGGQVGQVRQKIFPDAKKVGVGLGKSQILQAGQDSHGEIVVAVIVASVPHLKRGRGFGLGFLNRGQPCHFTRVVNASLYSSTLRLISCLPVEKGPSTQGQINFDITWQTRGRWKASIVTEGSKRQKKHRSRFTFIHI